MQTGPGLAFLIGETLGSQNGSTEIPSWSSVPEPQSLSFKDKQQRVILVVRYKTGKMTSLGLKQAARAFQAKGRAEDRCQEVTE